MKWTARLESQWRDLWGHAILSGIGARELPEMCGDGKYLSHPNSGFGIFLNSHDLSDKMREAEQWEL
jgi:hypothetical protein